MDMWFHLRDKQGNLVGDDVNVLEAYFDEAKAKNLNNKRARRRDAAAERGKLLLSPADKKGSPQYRRKLLLMFPVPAEQSKNDQRRMITEALIATSEIPL